MHSDSNPPAGRAQRPRRRPAPESPTPQPEPAGELSPPGEPAPHDAAPVAGPSPATEVEPPAPTSKKRRRVRNQDLVGSRTPAPPTATQAYFDSFGEF